jgi:PAS domain S-box-containing protein
MDDLRANDQSNHRIYFGVLSLLLGALCLLAVLTVVGGVTGSVATWIFGVSNLAFATFVLRLLRERTRRNTFWESKLLALHSKMHEKSKIDRGYGQLAEFANSSTHSVYVTDASRRITWVNSGFTRITGYSLADVVGQTPSDVLRSDRTDLVEVARLRDATAQGLGYRGTILKRGKDGREFWLDVDVQPQRNDAGEVCGYLGIEVDVTSQVSERERWRSIFSAVSEGIVLQNASGEIVECNSAAERILCLSRSELMGLTSEDQRWNTIREDGAELVASEHPAIRTLRTGVSIRNFVFGVQSTEGQRRWISVSTEPVYNLAGAVSSVVSSFSDITMQREQSQRLQFIVDGSRIGTWDWNIPTGECQFNEAWAKMLGYELSEMESHVTAWERILDPAALLQVWTVVQEHLDGRTADYRNELRLKRKDGSYAWVLATGRVIARSVEGKPIRMVGIHLDITESKRMEFEFKALTERYSAAVSGTSDGLWDWEWGTENVWYSDRFWTLLGFEESGPFPPSTFQSFYERLHPDDVEPTMLAIRRNHERGYDYDQEYRLRTESGNYRWFRARGATQFDQQHTPIRMAGSLQDIHELKWAERSLIESREQAENALREVHALRKALDEHSLLSVADRSGKIIDVNTGFLRISGYEREELLGEDHKILNSGYHPKEFWVAVWRQIASGDAWRGEVCNRRKNGSLYWVDSTIVPYFGSDGRIEKYVSIRFDVTAQKATEQALLAAQRDADAASAAKSEFLANMSHEIRTPMTAILGFTDLLASEVDGEIGPQLRLDYVETIRRNGEHLLQIINDILDISKIEAGKMAMEYVAVDTSQMVNDVLALMRVKASAKGLKLHWTMAGTIPEMIHSDPVRLRQILVNLIGNAIKFTELGEVSVHVDFHADVDLISFAVHDTGIGMTNEQIDRLFGAFEQADTSTTRKYGGTGLGLRISKRLAQLLGGDITVTSAIDSGSTFTLSINAGTFAIDGLQSVEEPLTMRADVEEKQSQQHQGAAAMPLAGMRLLLAEDGPDNQRLIAHILRKNGAEVQVAENGKIAIEMLTIDGTIEGILRSPSPFDVMISDMQMPVLDGYSTVRLLRSKGGKMPIIALTANAMSSDVEKCMEAGCNAYASKPIDKAILISLCQEWAQRGSKIRVMSDHGSTLNTISAP